MIIILCTIPNHTSLVSKITKNLLNQKLAACITIINTVQSFYYWNNTLTTDTEIQLLIKTRNTLKTSVFKTIKEIHPYKIPELLVLPILDGDSNYLSWMQSVLPQT
ncbi:divalent-cation tolerance protein CutA [Candidatus Blochmannia ocreatus (nom. nud.)]|uniref:Divalent-cation tolerance protein CutA n=1 Tax=Candidatus Blochmannia ocreatus (nom. nud.) TaxID=251538 RepID=A0ABY4SWI4_9ENTR|nr:divalent-cation tolerance protein CutA [Candidatus Blochmannia ocreatus]URJ25156.1 divalent-cation tolerance protein CutA [Candidatus Blochmannia ocreatus]